MVYTAALATILFYAANVPLCVAFFAKLGEEARFGIGISTFEGRLALKSASENPMKLQGKKGMPHPSVRFLLKALWEILRKTKPLKLYARIGTGDAALTALLCGAVSGIAPFFERSDIAPVFEKPYLELSGIIEIRAGNIIRAMALAGLQSIRRSIQMKG